MIKDPNAEDYSNFDEAISDSEDEVSYFYLGKERSIASTYLNIPPTKKFFLLKGAKIQKIPNLYISTFDI